MDRLSQLADDELQHVLSYLDVADIGIIAQVSKRCMEVANNDDCWQVHTMNICTSYTLDRDDFEGNFLYFLLMGDLLLPKYNGPPLRMPYLTPDDFDESYPYGGRTYAKIGDEGLMHRCYPSAQRDRAWHDRTGHVWITSKFPVLCCGAQHASRADVEKHCLDMRHYERLQGERGLGQLPEISIDPRLLLGQEAFEILSKREQYLRMRRYIDSILPEIKEQCDPANWDAADMANLQRLSRHGLSFVDELCERSRYDDNDNEYFEELIDEARMSCQPDAIGEHICNSVLEGFQTTGVYTEVPHVPYFSVRDFLIRGLQACDQDLESGSGESWWSGVNELFRLHYNSASPIRRPVAVDG
jgi:hypothetical protein